MSFAPLRAVPIGLIQAVAASSDYRASAERLLEQVCRLDNLLSQAIVAEMVSGVEAYIFDPDLYNRRKGTDIFRQIRKEADSIQSHFSLLSDVAEWPNYVSHMTANVLCAYDQKRHMVATIDSGPEREIVYQNLNAMTYEWALATYMGLSPLPVFGINIDCARPEVANFLSQSGLGTFVYLHLALNPACLLGDMLPQELDHQGIPRPVASLPILREPDGSLTLASQT